MTTATYLRKLIHDSGKTQLEVANLIGISERQLRRYLRLGQNKEPPIKVVLACERVLLP